MAEGGWIGVDLDGTLAFAPDERLGPLAEIGDPVPAMLARVKAWLAEGTQVKIFTARASDPNYGALSVVGIQRWCLEHLGRVLEVCCAKDMRTIAIVDNRAWHVVKNTGEIQPPIVEPAGVSADG